MNRERSMCVVCAWRQTCNKKFWIVSSSAKQCPDYVRDLALKAPKEDEATKEPLSSHEED